MLGPGDADELLRRSKAAFDGFFGGAIVFAHHVRLTLDHGASAPAYEGEILDTPRGTPVRFGLTVFVDGDRNANLMLLGSRPDFMGKLTRLAKSVRFVQDGAEPALDAPKGWNRHQAGCVTFELPASFPPASTLLFGDSKLDDIAFRITLDEAPAPEGRISFEDELPAVPGDRVVVLATAVTPRRPNARSWAGRWSVEHSSPLEVRRVALRKASVVLPVHDVAVTLYGKSLAANELVLDAGWETILQTIHERRAT
jgi:hypothetical protein